MVFRWFNIGDIIRLGLFYGGYKYGLPMCRVCSMNVVRFQQAISSFQAFQRTQWVV